MLQIVPNRPHVVDALYLAMLSLQPAALTPLHDVTVTPAEQAEAEEMLAGALDDNGRCSGVARSESP